jgi:hypothetical protein
MAKYYAQSCSLVDFGRRPVRETPIRQRILLALAVSLALDIATFAREKTTKLTGWVSDENCGAKHTRAGGAGCIRKCMRGGEDIGHPEWKPQRAVFVADRDGKVWIVENPETIRGQEGRHVTITARLDATKNTVRVKQVSVLGNEQEKQ